MAARAADHKGVAARALIASCGRKPVVRVNYSDVAAAGEAILQAHLSPTTRYCRIAHLRQFVRYFVAEGAAGGCVQAVPKVPVSRPRWQTFSGEEVACLIANASADLRLLILLCHDCCLRSLTACSLTWSHVHLGEGEIVAPTKRAAIARVPISGRLQEMLALVPPGNGTLLELLRGRKVSRERYRQQWRTLQKKLWPHMPTRTLHDLRRSMAESAYRVCGDLRVVQTLLGHTTLNSTTWYLQRPLQSSLSATAKAQRQVTSEAGGKR